MTVVPLTRISSDETQRLLAMEDELHKTVISQHEAICAIAKAVRKSRAGLKDPKRPIGSFIFAGPTGVGKTLLAKRLASSVLPTPVGPAKMKLPMGQIGRAHV